MVARSVTVSGDDQRFPLWLFCTLVGMGITGIHFKIGVAKKITLTEENSIKVVDSILQQASETPGFDFTPGKKINGSSVVYDAVERRLKLETTFAYSDTGEVQQQILKTFYTIGERLEESAFELTSAPWKQSNPGMSQITLDDLREFLHGKRIEITYAN